MAARCAAMRGASASTVTSALTSAEPAFVHHRGHGAQEQPAVGAAIARIGVRKMTADVALAERPQHGIAQRMDHHVAVGVRDDAAVVGNAHAAEHDVVAVAERMHVETLADSHFAGIVRFSAAFSIRAAAARSEARVTLMLNGEPCTRAAGAEPLHRLRLIGHRGVRARRLLERLRQSTQSKGLRRQRAPQSVPVHGLAHHAVALALHRVDDRRGEHRAAGTRLERVDQGRDIGRLETGPRRIVHEHPVIGRGTPLQGFEAVQHGLLAARAADRGEELRGAERSDELGPARIVGGNHDDDAPDARLAEQRAQRPLEHGRTGERCVLLGCACAGPLEPLAAAGRRNHGPDPARLSPRGHSARAVMAVGGAAGGAWPASRSGRTSRCCPPCRARCGRAPRARRGRLSDRSPRRATDGCARAARRWRRFVPRPPAAGARSRACPDRTPIAGIAARPGITPRMTAKILMRTGA